MRLIVYIFFFYLTCNAEIITAIGKAKPEYSNLDNAIKDAKQNALTRYIQSRYSDSVICLDKHFEIDRDDFEIELIREKELTLSPQNLIVSAEFEINEKIDIYKELKELCEEEIESKLKRAKFQRSVKEKKEQFFRLIDGFHIGAGAFAWSETQGGELFLSYEKEFFSLYGLWGYQSTYSLNEKESNLINATAETLGTEIQLQFGFNMSFLVGYDFYVKQSENEKITKSATSSFSWGLSYKTQSKKWEFALVFKEFDDSNENDSPSESGGLRVRYKFF